MELQEKYQIEKDKWDSSAKRMESTIGVLKSGADFHKIANSKVEMKGVSDFLGDLHGKKVLEIGCGIGFMATLLARSGAKVTALDISPESVRVARQMAEKNGVADNIEFAVAVGEKLPYPNDTFDIVFGKGVLHHLEVDPGADEIRRVLKPGGKAAFSEPMGMNPLLNFAREHVPYTRKNEHGADRPLNYEDIRLWGQGFRKFDYTEVQLFSMLERAFGFKKRFSMLRSLDDALLKRMPFLRRYCRYIVMLMVK